jgi:hypothetical protein
LIYGFFQISFELGKIFRIQSTKSTLSNIP